MKNDAPEASSSFEISLDYFATANYGAHYYKLLLMYNEANREHLLHYQSVCGT